MQAALPALSLSCRARARRAPLLLIPMADAVEPVEIGDQIQARPTSVTSSPMGEYADFEPRFALGRGQFGVVYLMQHRKDPTQKAVDKRVQLLGLSEEQRVQTFKEIKLLANLQHEYIACGTITRGRVRRMLPRTARRRRGPCTS